MRAKVRGTENPLDMHVDAEKASLGFTPFEHVSEDAQETIWARVLFFAMDADYVYSEAELASCTPRRFQLQGKTVKLSHMRLWISTTCHRFYRLAHKYLGQDLEL